MVMVMRRVSGDVWKSQMGEVRGLMYVLAGL